MHIATNICFINISNMAIIVQISALKFTNMIKSFLYTLIQLICTFTYQQLKINNTLIKNMNLFWHKLSFAFHLSVNLLSLCLKLISPSILPFLLSPHSLPLSLFHLILLFSVFKICLSVYLSICLSLSISLSLSFKLSQHGHDQGFALSVNHICL